MFLNRYFLFNFVLSNALNVLTFEERTANVYA